MSETSYADKTGNMWADRGREPDACPGCGGCGQVANDDERTPWWHWALLPAPSNMAVTMEIVRPETCVRCDGTGITQVTQAGAAREEN